jgi:phosphoglycerate kinase
MAKRSLASLNAGDLSGKRVLVRVDFNVPLNDAGAITDDTRIRAALPTINDLVGKGAKVVLAAHFGRPKGQVNEAMRLTPVAARLSELLGKTVTKTDSCIGPDAEAKVGAMANGDVVLLENVRFVAEEEKNDAGFAEKLAALADVYVNDAFGAAHRAHASTEGVTKFLKPSVAGFLMEKELQYLQGAVDEPKRPLAAIVGGSKVSSKIGVLEALIDKCDKVLIGGGMIFTFYKARGLAVGKSLVEEDKLELAKELEAKAKAKGVELLLPTDVVLADNFAPDANSQIADVTAIPDGWMGLDIGPDAIKVFQAALADCKTVIWNGPMGVFEFDKFAAGTNAIATTLAEIGGKGCCTIIGGGDSVAAVEKAGLAEKMSHISTGGGASLELSKAKCCLALQPSTTPKQSPTNDKARNGFEMGPRMGAFLCVVYECEARLLTNRQSSLLTHLIHVGVMLFPKSPTRCFALLAGKFLSRLSTAPHRRKPSCDPSHSDVCRSWSSTRIYGPESTACSCSGVIGCSAWLLPRRSRQEQEQRANPTAAGHCRDDG